MNELFRSIPSGLGSKGTVKLTKSDLDELLVEGVGWAIEHGYGWKQDAEVCEEGGKMVGADTASVSEIARKRGAPQLGSLGSGNHFLEIQKVDKIFDERAAKAMGINNEGQLTVFNPLWFKRIWTSGVQRLFAHFRNCVTKSMV